MLGPLHEGADRLRRLRVKTTVPDQRDSGVSPRRLDVDPTITSNTDPVENPDPQDVPQIRHRPSVPTPGPTEVQEHNITHIPYKAWCPICVKARGRSDGHGGTSTDTTGIPLVAWDFAFFREHRGVASTPVLVGVDKDTGCLFAICLPSKGNLPGWVAVRVCKFLRELGHHGHVIQGRPRECSD